MPFGILPSPACAGSDPDHDPFWWHAWTTSDRYSDPWLSSAREQVPDSLTQTSAVWTLQPKQKSIYLSRSFPPDPRPKPKLSQPTSSSLVDPNYCLMGRGSYPGCAGRGGGGGCTARALRGHSLQLGLTPPPYSYCHLESNGGRRCWHPMVGHPCMNQRSAFVTTPNVYLQLGLLIPFPQLHANQTKQSTVEESIIWSIQFCLQRMQPYQKQKF